MKFIDDLLNRVSMYRLALYYLIGLLAAAVLLSFAGLLAYDPFALLFSTGFLVGVCALANWVFARVWRVPANSESVYISALILALIITPLQSYGDLWFLGWAAVLAMASKYMIAIGRKHLFNPVAFAVALTYFGVNQSASWWVGDAPMLPFVLLGGLLLARKLRRGDLLISFLAASTATITVASLFGGGGPVAALSRALFYSPLLFFAFIILTEPLTMPPDRPRRIVYGALVGFLFTPQFHLGSFYMTPELAILAGNLLAYLVSPKTTLVLTLKRKVALSPDVYDFIFAPSRRLAFAPGQYMEWTLGHADPDSRGNRRFFTLASSPTEDELHVGVKFYRQSSSFKRAMLAMNNRTEIVAAHLAGDFTLPADPERRCVFIAGGIGITPFRSMLKYLIDTQRRRPITIFYANHRAADILYRDVLEKARQMLGIKTVYTVTDARDLPPNWPVKTGRITAQMIRAEVPDYRDCLFYLSGPQSMIQAFADLLGRMNVPRAHIKTDLFSGLS